jgi:hypothetical protein
MAGLDGLGKMKKETPFCSSGLETLPFQLAA